MRRATARVVIAGVLSVLFTVAPAAATGTETIEASEAPDAYAEVRFRSDFGLATNAGALAAGRAAGHGWKSYGVPLTADEEAQIDHRFEMAERLDPFWEAIQGHPEFAGGFIDQKRGGVVVVRFTGDAEPNAALVEKTIPDGIPHEFIQADRTLAQLKEIQRAVDEAAPSARVNGINVISTYVDIESGRVVIGVDGLTESGRDYLHQEFGPAVQPVNDLPSTFAACTSRTNCAGPMKGGLTIVASVGGECTSGFMGRPSGAFTQLYVLTAGHCLDAT